MPKLTRDGVELYYEVHGEGVRRPPHPRLFVQLAHVGRPGRAVLQALQADHLGHAGPRASPTIPADQGYYSEAHTVADMAAILDAVGAEKAVVGGLSLGGYMSLAFHLRVHPERTRALLIIDTGPGYKKDEARAGWNATAIKRAERYELEAEGLAEERRGRDPHQRRTARPTAWPRRRGAC